MEQLAEPRAPQPEVVDGHDHRNPSLLAEVEQASGQVEQVVNMDDLRAHLIQHASEDSIHRRSTPGLLEGPREEVVDHLDHPQPGVLSLPGGEVRLGDVLLRGDHDHLVPRRRNVRTRDGGEHLHAGGVVRRVEVSGEEDAHGSEGAYSTLVPRAAECPEQPPVVARQREGLGASGSLAAGLRVARP